MSESAKWAVWMLAISAGFLWTIPARTAARDAGARAAAGALPAQEESAAGSTESQDGGRDDAAARSGGEAASAPDQPSGSLAALDVFATGFDSEQGHAIAKLYRPGENVLSPTPFRLVKSPIHERRASFHFADWHPARTRSSYFTTRTTMGPSITTCSGCPKSNSGSRMVSARGSSPVCPRSRSSSSGSPARRHLSDSTSR